MTGTPAGGTQLTFDVKVGTVQEKKLPEVTDEWAAESSEFSTVAELRDDIADRMRKVKVVQAQMSLRDAALGSLADLVDDAEVPDVLVDAEVNERLHDLSHRLDAQKISIEQFLSATGQSGDELVASLRGDAHRAVKVDLGLRGVAAAEEMVITDQELDDELGRMEEQYGTTTDSIREQLDQAGRTGEVKAALLKNKAATWLVENVAIVDEDGTAVDRTLLESNMADEADAADEDADTKEEK